MDTGYLYQFQKHTVNIITSNIAFCNIGFKLDNDSLILSGASYACRGWSAASAFLSVQLQRLAPRGHKPLQIKRQKPPFYLERLMLVGADRAASAFL
jgi:hypothetical protein